MAVLALTLLITVSTLGKAFAVHLKTFTFGAVASQVSHGGRLLSYDSQLRVVGHCRLLLQCLFSQTSRSFARWVFWKNGRTHRVIFWHFKNIVVDYLLFKLNFLRWFLFLGFCFLISLFNIAFLVLILVESSFVELPGILVVVTKL